MCRAKVLDYGEDKLRVEVQQLTPLTLLKYDLASVPHDESYLSMQKVIIS